MPESPDAVGRLEGLDLMTGKPIVACMATAAQLYGFYTEKNDRIDILDPGVRMRPTSGLAGECARLYRLVETCAKTV